MVEGGGSVLLVSFLDLILGRGRLDAQLIVEFCFFHHVCS